MTEPLVVTPAEAGEMLGVSRELIRQWVVAGILPEIAPHVTKKHLIPRAAVVRLVEEAMAGWNATAATNQLANGEHSLRSVS